MSSLFSRFTCFLSEVILDRVWLWFQKIFIKQAIVFTGSTDTVKQQSSTDYQFEHVIQLEDLPDELLLAICRYSRPVQVLNGFLDCNSRMFRCISDYLTHIDLTNCSYFDLQTIRNLIDHKRSQPPVLTLSNSMLI